MGYEVLSNDLYESSQNAKPKKKKMYTHHEDEEVDEPKSKGSNNIYIHIAIIIIILIGLFFYFSEDISFSSKSQPKLSSLNLIGSIENFSYNFSSDEVKLYSAEFTLETQGNILNGKSTDFIINNFSGEIILFNDTFIILQGKAQKLIYDKNVFQLNGQTIKLISNKKTIIPIYFKNTKLNFNNGRLSLDEKLNYEFINSSIFLNNYNSTLAYDGTFSFLGHCEEFEFISPLQHINLKYKE